MKEKHDALKDIFGDAFEWGDARISNFEPGFSISAPANKHVRIAFGWGDYESRTNNFRGKVDLAVSAATDHIERTGWGEDIADSLQVTGAPFDWDHARAAAVAVARVSDRLAPVLREFAEAGVPSDTLVDLANAPDVDHRSLAQIALACYLLIAGDQLRTGS